MPDVEVRVDTTHLEARIDAMLPSVRAALVKALGPLARDIASDAQSAALAHIRYEGAKNPGSYVASIYGDVKEDESRVVGFVRSSHPLAHLLELGFDYKAQDIVPRVATILAFEGDAGTVFRKRVHRDAMRVPAYPAIGPAFQAEEPEIRDVIEQAVRRAAS